MDRRKFIASAVGTFVAGALATVRAATSFGFARGVGHIGGVPSAASFDYYISTTGSDSNAGTLAAPWAITTLMYDSANWTKINGTGVSIGLLPGTYNISAYMANDPAHGALVVPGGASASAVNYIASCNSSGVYERGTVTLDAFATQVSDPAATITGASGSSATLNLSTSATGTAAAGQMIQMSGLPIDCYVASGSGSTWTIGSLSGATISNLSATQAALGLYGGFHSPSPGVYDGPIIGHTGQVYISGWQPYVYGNLVIDGLIFTGFSYKGIRVGGASSGDGPDHVPNVTIKNCTFTGSGFNYGDNQDNMNPIWLDTTVNAVVDNCWFHDNFGEGGIGSSDHVNAIILWGDSANSIAATGTVITRNTVVNAGDIYGKDQAMQQTTAQFNYVDSSMYVRFGSSGIGGFTGSNSTNLTGTSVFSNNIVVVRGDIAGGAVGVGGPPAIGNQYGWTTPVLVYNNTIITPSISSTGPQAIWITSNGGAQIYNNIYQTSQSSSGSFNNAGNVYTNPAALAVCDYNLYPSAAGDMAWTLYENTSYTTAIGSYSTPAAFASALAANGGISNAEAHTVMGVPTFTGTGLYAEQYQLASGSLGKGTGSTTGTTSGAACDMGAWGGPQPPTQIGCSFAT